MWLIDEFQNYHLLIVCNQSRNWKRAFLSSKPNLPITGVTVWTWTASGSLLCVVTSHTSETIWWICGTGWSFWGWRSRWSCWWFRSSLANITFFHVPSNPLDVVISFTAFSIEHVDWSDQFIQCFQKCTFKIIFMNK